MLGWPCPTSKTNTTPNAAQWIQANRERTLLTTSFVLDESITLIRRRLSHQHAKQFGEAFFKSNVAQLVQINHADIQNAWNLFVRYGDQDFSFTDCTSFAVMKRLKLQEALAFDKHFSTMGFTLLA